MAITNKNNNKLIDLELSIQISLSGLSFCILNRNLNSIDFLKEIKFEKSLNPFEVLDKLKQCFSHEDALSNTFSKIRVIHDNDLSTLVPVSLFNKIYLADYLKFNSKILKSDFIAFDTITKNDSVNVYVPYININNFIFDKFGSFTFKHVSTILIESIIQFKKPLFPKEMYINVSSNHFEILVFKNNKLEFYNSFTYQSKEDFIYYILFTIQQLNLDPETVKLVFIGDITNNDEYYNITFKYVRNISFGETYINYDFVNKPQLPYSNYTLLNSF